MLLQCHLIYNPLSFSAFVTLPSPFPLSTHLYFMCMDVLHAYMCVHHICAWYLQMSEKSIRSPRISYRGCEPPCELWESNLGPLQQQSVFSTPEPSLQPLHIFFYMELIEDIFCISTNKRDHYLLLYSSLAFLELCHLAIECECKK